MSTQKTATKKATTKKAIRKSSGKKLAATVKDEKKETITLIPSLINIGKLAPLPNSVDWFQLKYDVSRLCVKVAEMGVKADSIVGLTARQIELVKGAVKDGLEILEDYRGQLEDTDLPEEQRLEAYQKAMKVTPAALQEKALNVTAGALKAVEDYLEAEGQEEKYSYAMEALDSLLYDRRCSSPDTRQYKTLITELTRLLFVPEVGTRFYEATRFTPAQVAGFMERLSDFFTALQGNSVKADTERYSIQEHYCRYSFDALQWRQWDYNKMAAKCRATYKVDEEFDAIGF